MSFSFVFLSISPCKIKMLCGRPKRLRKKVKICTRPQNGMHNNIPNVHYHLTTFVKMGHPIAYASFCKYDELDTVENYYFPVDWTVISQKTLKNNVVEYAVSVCKALYVSSYIRIFSLSSDVRSFCPKLSSGQFGLDSNKLCN